MRVSRASAYLQGYSPTSASEYDGSADYQLRGGSPTGIADGKAGTLSAWVKYASAGNGVTQRIIQATGDAFLVSKSVGNTITVIAENAAGTRVLDQAGTVQVTSANGWVNILTSWDLAAAKFHLFIHDANANPTSNTLTDDTIDYTVAEWGIGANVSGANKLNACLAELFFHTTYIDLSVIANRRKFISQFGRPRFLGADGSLPLGVQPLIYVPTGDASGTNNKGTGGAWTTTGALAACATVP